MIILKQKVFKAKMGKFFIFSLLAIASAAWLIYYGYKMLIFFKNDELFKTVYCYIPIGMGGLIIFLLIINFFANLGKTIVITPDAFYYKHFGKEFAVDWKNISFTPPQVSKKRFRSAAVSDGKNLIRFDDFFFPQFETIVEVIKMAREAQRELRI
ncbi:MAG: hypothetical protein M1536_06380 [Firmicutes bacterium]|nr:hypothetical protein [Bacillota bacterium]